MPALPSVPGVAKIILRHTIGDDTTAAARFFMRYGAGWTGPLAVLAADAIALAWNAHLAARTVNTTNLHEVDVEDLASPSSPVGSASVVHPGTIAPASETPNSACFRIDFQIGRRYRGGKPCIYCPSPDLNELTGGRTFQPAGLAANEAAWNAFIAAVVAGTAGNLILSDQVNVSYYEGFTPHTGTTGRVRNVPNRRGTPLVDDVIAAIGNPTLASQRRRNYV